MTPGTGHLQLEELLARTDRGELWRSAAGTLVRLIEPRYCDTQFRQGLERLRQGAWPSTVRITAAGWQGMKFYLEYRIEGCWLPMATHWERLHWRLRLPFLRRICELLPEWAHAVGYPVGINPANIIAIEIAGHWFPWLLPCPSVVHASPLDLLDCDEPVLACIPPEVIRGVALDGRAQDAYSVGSLAWRTLGARIADPQWDASERMEAQACGWMMNHRVETTSVEPFLHHLNEVKGLAGLASRYSQLDFVARPTAPSEMSLACDAAFAATDPVLLAQQLMQASRSHNSLEVVDWGLATFPPSLQLYLAGATIAEKLEDFPRAIFYLDGAFALRPNDLALRFRRCDLRWVVYRHLRKSVVPEADPSGDALLQDLELCKQFRADKDPCEPYVRGAYIYRRRGDLHAAADELYKATEMEQSDIALIYEYAKVLHEMGQPELVRAALAEGLRRTDLMVKAEMMQKSEARTWRELFDSLLRG
jgi:hypothetical protein